jgi:hypothetical protein
MSLHMGFVGDRVLVEQFSLQPFLGFPLSVAVHQMNASYIALIYHQCIYSKQLTVSLYATSVWHCFPLKLVMQKTR